MIIYNAQAVYQQKGEAGRSHNHRGNSTLVRKIYKIRSLIVLIVILYELSGVLLNRTMFVYTYVMNFIPTVIYQQTHKTEYKLVCGALIKLNAHE